ncbi:MAG: hypothetical protein NTW19_18760 [Planctomycetota bacterium]|nr:hypothetical protein [Planctomycetota bacterium]
MADKNGRMAYVFTALWPRWFSPDRLFRVHVSDRMLAGGYVAGQIYSEQAAAIQLHVALLVLWPWIRRMVAQRRERETALDAMDPFAPEFLQQDRRNFQIAKADVLRSHLKRGWNWWAPAAGGELQLELAGGRKVRLILAEDQDTDRVLGVMRLFDPHIKVSGKNRATRPPMKP